MCLFKHIPLHQIPHPHKNSHGQESQRDNVAVADKKIFEMSDEVDPQDNGYEGCRKNGYQCFSVAKPDDIAYETAYDGPCHGDGAEHEEDQAGDTVLFDMGLIFPHRLL